MAAIALATALTESNLRMYANENVPESLHLPHEAVGSDHKSVGLFQQQVGIWGTAAELMNAEHSCTLFLNALDRVDWSGLDNWMACQRVPELGLRRPTLVRPTTTAPSTAGITTSWTARPPPWPGSSGQVPAHSSARHHHRRRGSTSSTPSPTRRCSRPRPAPTRTGTLKKGTSYVFGKRLGREIRVAPT